MGDRDSEFSEYVDARALVLRRTAYLLCGDWHRAEDVVQTAFAKLCAGKTGRSPRPRGCSGTGSRCSAAWRPLWSRP